MSQVKPPRSAFINFPLGRQCGPPRDVDMQTQILKDVLNLLGSAKIPGDIADLPYKWDRPFDFSGFMLDLQHMLQEEDSAPQEWKTEE